MSEINLTQLFEQEKAYSQWFLPDDETERRIKLIDECIIDYSSTSEQFDKFFKLKGTVKSIKPAYIMAHIKQISDDLLIDYISGIGHLMLYLSYVKEEDMELCNRYILPSVNILKELLCSGFWRDFIIGSEVTGQEFQIINGMTIPFTPEAIKLHINRIRAFPIISDDIAKIKADYRKYNIRLYGDELIVDNKIENNQKAEHSKSYNLDAELINNVYTICNNYDLFECDQLEFFIAVGTANFSLLKINKIQKTKHLIYRMSIVMGKEWYADTVKSLGWVKDNCSGLDGKLETDQWAKKINRILPRL